MNTNETPRLSRNKKLGVIAASLTLVGAGLFGAAAVVSSDSIPESGVAGGPSENALTDFEDGIGTTPIVTGGSDSSGGSGSPGGGSTDGGSGSDPVEPDPGTPPPGPIPVPEAPEDPPSEDPSPGDPAGPGESGLPDGVAGMEEAVNADLGEGLAERLDEARQRGLQRPPCPPEVCEPIVFE